MSSLAREEPTTNLLSLYHPVFAELVETERCFIRAQISERRWAAIAQLADVRYVQTRRQGDPERYDQAGQHQTDAYQHLLNARAEVARLGELRTRLEERLVAEGDAVTGDGDADSGGGAS